MQGRDMHGRHRGPDGRSERRGGAMAVGRRRRRRGRLPSASTHGHRTAPPFRSPVGPPVPAMHGSSLHGSSIASTGGGTGADDGGNMLDALQQQAKANPLTDPAVSTLATASANDAMFYQAVLLAIAAVSLAAVWSL